ncbi:hypothetical protein CJD92_22330 [Salmonella enterica subsp. enterica serovar Newport]|nr:hypothetical protein [Salmonella enterica subsp. enterica serovar Newport]
MSRNFKNLKPLKEEAKRIGNKTFLCDTPCEKCNSYEIYTNQKGYRCVGCHINKKAIHTEKNIEKVRAQRRESYNRNRPTHNPEKIVFDTVKAAGFYEAGTITQAEFDSVAIKGSLLKHANGTGKAEYTLDHIHPKAGFKLPDGRTLYGRATSENLRIIPIAMNKAKSNLIDSTNIEFNPKVHAMKDSTSTYLDSLSSTEEMRKIFYKKWGVVTKQNSDYQKKLDDGTSNTVKIDKEALTPYQVARKFLVLELMLGGINRKNLFGEDYPLPDVWDDDKNRFVKPIIKPERGLYSRDVMRNMYSALRWVDIAKDCLYWRKNKMPLSDVFNDSDIEQRIEQHFTEWVYDWTMNKSGMKIIFDFLELPSKQEREDFKNAHFKKRDSSYVIPAEKIKPVHGKKVITQSQADDMNDVFNFIGYEIVSDELFNSLSTTNTFYRFN